MTSPNPFSLQDKIALVTGGAVNIGRAITLALTQAGARVAIGYHSHQTEAEDLAAQLGEKAFPLPLDVTSESSIQAAIERCHQHFGGLDLLVNNAGIFSINLQADLPADDWDQLFAVNVRGLFLTSRTAAPLMATRGGGSILHIASINAFHPGFGLTAHYDASKGAVLAYTRSLAAELAPQKIRVNGIAPGLVDAPDLRRDFPELVQQVETRTPLKELTPASAVGQAAVFLASPAASQITGQTLVVDGGYLLT